MSGGEGGDLRCVVPREITYIVLSIIYTYKPRVLVCRGALELY